MADRYPSIYQRARKEACLTLMTAVAFWLRSLGVQHHDSMYLTLPLIMVFLFT